MAFPADPTDLKVELDLVGDWSDPEDITQYVYSRAPVTIKRGKTAEGATVDPSTMDLTLNNRDGRFSSRNPTGPYFGSLGRNTPIRLSVTAGETRFATIEGATGSVFFTADSAQQDITGDIDVRIDCYLPFWHGTEATALVYKWTASSQQSYFLQLDLAGTLTLFWSTTGANTLSSTSTQVLPFTTGRHSVRATLDVNNGASGRTVTFYYGTGGVDGSWTQLGDAVVTAGTTSIFNSTSGVSVDAGATVHPERAVYAAQVRNGIGGTVAANPDFTIQTEGDQSFADSAGATWTATGGSSTTARRVRFVGEVAAWPVKWDSSGQDVYVEIQAAGVLRRLSQGASPLYDSMRRLAVLNNAVAYWPLDDPRGAIDATPAIGRFKLVYSNLTTGAFTAAPPNFGEGSLYPHLPQCVATAKAGTGDISGGQFSAHVASADEGNFAFDVLYRAAPGDNDTDDPMNTEFFIYTSTGIRWSWRPSNNFANIEVAAYLGDTTFIDGNSVSTGSLFDGETHHVRLEVAELTSTTSQYRFYIDGTQISQDTFTTNVPLGHPRDFLIDWFSDSVQAQVAPVYFGQLIVWNAASSDYPTVSDAVDASLGYAGETAADRLTRLTGEEGVDLLILGDADDNETMGPQRALTLVDLLRECEATDQGLLYEPRHTGGLCYLTRFGVENQVAGLTLDYDSKHLSKFEPVEDDSALRNDVTLSDTLGSAFQTTQDEGALSTAAPPSGVGRYTESATVNPETENQLPDLAGWRLHLGTVDEARYPTIGIALHRSVFTASSSLTSDALDLDVGQVLEVTDLPAWLPPDDLQQLVQGTTETLSNFTYDIEYNCAPASPWTVAVYDDTRFRLHSDGSTLNEDLTTTETDVDVATASGPLWGHGDGDFDIMVGGERMTVTAISGSTSPQTFTVTRSVNGVVKTHSSGATVDLFQPSIYAIKGG